MRPKIPRQNLVVEAPVARWQTIYCSFALILVVFFAMMVSYSIVSGKGLKTIRKHFVRGSSLHAPGSSLRPLVGIRATESGEGLSVIIRDAATRFGLGNTVSVQMASGGIDIVMKDTTLFRKGAVDVEKRIYPYLNVVGDVAARNGLQVQVKAHTVGSSDRGAWDLSAQRAVNIMRYFLAYGRLAPDQVSAAGYVETGDKVKGNEGAETKVENRVELHLSVSE
ncbi:MAG: OmpA family protein [Syntrophaceae bacterium]|nr:OmpA family protein [Syntrophaceae bacterium]